MKEYIYTTSVTPNLEIKHSRDLIVKKHYSDYQDDDWFFEHVIRSVQIAAYEVKNDENDDYSDIIPASQLNEIQKLDNGTLQIQYAARQIEISDIKAHHVDLLLWHILVESEDKLRSLEREVLEIQAEIHQIKQCIKENL